MVFAKIQGDIVPQIILIYLTDFKVYELTGSSSVNL
jgi:hypothetical protein